MTAEVVIGEMGVSVSVGTGSTVVTNTAEPIVTTSGVGVPGTPGAPGTPGSGVMTFIGDTTWSGGSSVTISSIPQTYRHLLIYASVRSNTSPVALGMRFNGDIASTHYRSQTHEISGTTPTTYIVSATVSGYGRVGSMNSALGMNIIEIPFYREASHSRMAFGRSMNGATPVLIHQAGVTWTETAAITSVTFVPSSGVFGATCTASLYGIA